MARRKYSDEYKKEAVAMTELPGATITGGAGVSSLKSMVRRHSLVRAMPVMRR
jgi:transposase-like protein